MESMAMILAMVETAVIVIGPKGCLTTVNEDVGAAEVAGWIWLVVSMRIASNANRATMVE